MSDLHSEDGAPVPPVAEPPVSASWWRRHRAGVILWGLVVVVAAAIAGAIALAPPPPPPPPEASRKPVPVHTMVARADGFTDVLELPGRIEPRIAATLAAEKPGRIVAVEADRGDRVKAGQVLVRLDRDAWEARLRQAEIEQREARRDLSRIEDLRKTGAVSQSDYDAAEARRDRTDASLADARAQVRQCEVVSPIDGEVTDRLVEAGEHATEGRAVIRVVDISSVKVVFDLPERAVGDIAAGRAVALAVGGAGGGAWTAVVSFVSAEADPHSNTFRVEARLPNPDGALRAGMIARVRVERPVPPGYVAIPLAAVVPRRGEHVVFVAAGNRAIRRVVTLDRIAGGQAVLSAGVAAGEAVVVDGHRGLMDGIEVEVVDGGSPPASGAGS